MSCTIYKKTGIKGDLLAVKNRNDIYLSLDGMPIMLLKRNTLQNAELAEACRFIADILVGNSDNMTDITVVSRSGPNIEQPRCCVCGRFISIGELNVGSAVVEFTPDSHYSVEKVQYKHRFCNKFELPCG